MVIKLGTWNIGKLNEDYEKNLSILTDVLSKHCPNILFFQEYVPNPTMEKHIFEKTGLQKIYYKEFSPSHVAIGKQMGIAVFSYNINHIIENAIYSLVKPNREYYYKGKIERFHDKYFLSLSVQYRDNTLTFLTGHGFAFHRYQENPADFPDVFQPLDDWLCSHIKEKKTIAIGDFNIEDAMNRLPKLFAHFTDIFANVSTRPSGRKTDYILIPSNMSFSDSVNLCCGNYDQGTGLDHNYLYAAVKI